MAKLRQVRTTPRAASVTRREAASAVKAAIALRTGRTVSSTSRTDVHAERPRK